MTNRRTTDSKAAYEIKVLGKLDRTWADWFDGFSFTYHGDETWLKGEVTDQAALLGILTKIIGLGLTLRSVESK